MKAYIGIILITLMLTCVGATNEHHRKEYPVTKRITVRDIIDAGLKEIGYAQHVYVVVRDIPPRLRKYAKANGITFDAFVTGKDGTYILYYDKDGISDTQRYKVIAHELIHLQQLQSRRLRIINDRSVWWEGQIIPDIRKIYYTSRPWEAEANNLHGKLSSKIKKRLKSNN